MEKFKLKYIGFILSFFFSKQLYSKPIFSVAGGLAFAPYVGQSQGFLIQNIEQDEYYNYSVKSRSQTKGTFDIFFGWEQQVKDYWLLDYGINYNQPGNFSANGILVQGTDTNSQDIYSYHYGLSNKALLFQSKILYQFHQNLYPYILAGIGGAYNKAYEYNTTVPPFLTFTRMYANQSNISFSYLFGIGIDNEVSKHLRLGLGYHYLNFGSYSLGPAMIDTSQVSGELSQSGFDTHQFLAQITFLL